MIVGVPSSDKEEIGEICEVMDFLNCHLQIRQVICGTLYWKGISALN
jgi:hypothetical protein